MKRPLTFGLAFGLAIFVSVGPRAQNTVSGAAWEVLSASERAIVDRLAADFYEHDLRSAQSDAIEARTAQIYASRTAEERARFRDERRLAWRTMSTGEQSALRNAKRPVYSNLTEDQKAPFRRHALDRLGGAGALDRDALANALRQDI